MRSLNIGRSLYNINKIAGNKIISDIHLGDWGMPVAQIINFCEDKGIDIENLEIAQLEEIYPSASSLYNQDINFQESAKNINKKLNDSDFKSLNFRAMKPYYCFCLIFTKLGLFYYIFDRATLPSKIYCFVKNRFITYPLGKHTQFFFRALSNSVGL